TAKTTLVGKDIDRAGESPQRIGKLKTLDCQVAELICHQLLEHFDRRQLDNVRGLPLECFSLSNQLDLFLLQATHLLTDGGAIAPIANELDEVAPFALVLG